MRQTSLEAYTYIKDTGVLSSRRFQIYEILFTHGPLTSNEIFQRLDGTSEINNPNVHSRLNELREYGCVYEVGTKICTVTEMTVILWDVTDKLPKKLSKREQLEKSKSNLIERLDKVTAELQALEAK